MTLIVRMPDLKFFFGFRFIKHKYGSYNIMARLN